MTITVACRTRANFSPSLANGCARPARLHGMSRRELARRSGMSERYVAQIEAGKGNVSIVRLLRIALVFRCDEPSA